MLSSTLLCPKNAPLLLFFPLSNRADMTRVYTFLSLSPSLDRPSWLAGMCRAGLSRWAPHLQTLSRSGRRRQDWHPRGSGSGPTIQTARSPNWLRLRCRDPLETKSKPTISPILYMLTIRQTRYAYNLWSSRRYQALFSTRLKSYLHLVPPRWSSDYILVLLSLMYFCRHFSSNLLFPFSAINSSLIISTTNRTIPPAPKIPTMTGPAMTLSLDLCPGLVTRRHCRPTIGPATDRLPDLRGPL